ncbi:uncharacterized protein LOC144432391 [Styela clava]
MPLSWLKRGASRLNKDEKRLQDKIKVLKETQKRHEEVKTTKDKLQQDLATKQKLFTQIKKEIPKTQKELKTAQAELKTATGDLKSMEKAATKAGSKVTIEEFDQVLKREFELGKRQGEVLPESRKIEQPVYVITPAADLMPTAPIDDESPPEYRTVAKKRASDQQLESMARDPEIPEGPVILIEKGLDHQTIKKVYPKLEGKTVAYPVVGVQGVDVVKDGRVKSGRLLTTPGENPGGVKLLPSQRAMLIPKPIFPTPGFSRSEERDHERFMNNWWLAETNKPLPGYTGSKGYQEAEIRSPDIVVPAPDATPRQRPLARRLSLDSFDSDVTPAPSKPWNVNEMMAVMKNPAETHILRFMEDSMRFIPHGEGNTIADRILSNAMQEKLRQAGRIGDADQIAEFFNEPNPSWTEIMKLLALSNPQGIVNNERVINRFASAYTWKQRPIQAIHRALREMDIPFTSPILNDQDGIRLFRILRAKLPLSLRLLLQGKEHYDWQTLAEELEQFWNSEDLDKQATDSSRGLERKGGSCNPPAQVMATSTPPVNVYNIHPDLTAIKNALPTYPIDGVSEEVQRALERRMREPSRPPPVPRRQEPIEQPRRNPARTTRTTDKPWMRDAPRRGKEKQAARGNFTSQRSEPRALNEGTRPTSSRQQPPVGRETTPSNSEEALQIAEREGSSYDFLANANIFAPLGLYTTPTNGQSLAVCYLCKAPGHLSKNCVVKAILWLSDKVLAKNDGGQWGIKERARPLPDHVREENIANWGAFLGGHNPLGLRLKGVKELDDYFATQGSPPLVERANLCEDYFGTRPKERDKTHWLNRNQWRPPVTAEPRNKQRPVPTHWTQPQVQQGLDVAGNGIGSWRDSQQMRH